MLLALAAPACLVAEPPSYEEPRRTPPILDLYAAKPFIGGVIPIARSASLELPDRIDFKIPVRSDDQGEDLWWMLYADRTFSNELLVWGPQRVPASTLDDTTRYVQYTWIEDTRYAKGCHTLSFVVAHLSSWDLVGPPMLLDATDAAVGTFWINVDPGLTDPNTLPHCPSRTEF